MLVYLLKTLPWQGLKVEKNEKRYKKILNKKKKITEEELTEGLPSKKIINKIIKIKRWILWIFQIHKKVRI